MTVKTRAAALAALFLCGPAQAMSSAEFLAKADALKAKGMLAMFSPDLGLLKAEFANAGKVWRAQAHKPNACPPAAPIKADSDMIYALVAAVPPQQRATTSATDAIVAGLNRKYPCR
jgi:hypothetical protein